ncbi:MAG: phasin family protein [Cellvibrionaceae bacterium]
MTDLNEQFKEFAKLQADFFKPLREANGLMADSFESFARLGYAVQGDLVDYAVEQTQLAASAEDMTGLVSKQYEKAKELGEKMTSRFNESSELSKDYFSSLQKVEIAPMFEAPAKATAKAAKSAKAAA